VKAGSTVGPKSGSYTSAIGNPFRLVRDARHLYQTHANDVPRRVDEILRRLHEIERLARDRLELELSGLRVLDIGAGQMALQAAYFSRSNDVVGIDRDLIVRGLDVGGYMRMARQNGLRRVVKTVGRKLVGLDRSYAREMGRRLGLAELRLPPVRQMDAAQLDFPDASFDFAYSLVVFQHLERPERALGEMIRVLRPGGGLYIDLIVYSSRTGSLDFRLLGGRNTDLPLWAHLRPRYLGLVRPSAHVNELRLGEWEDLFHGRMPGCEVIRQQPEIDWLKPEALALQAAGELPDYSLDELVTTKLVVIWRKPGPQAR
jgi:SAM-dependent methyltransferase